MAKRSLAVKLLVVRYRDWYQLGFKATAKHFGINDGLARRWYGAYQSHGEEGLKRRYRQYSPAFKAAVGQRMTTEGRGKGVRCN